MSELERWQRRFSTPGYLFGTAPNAFLQSKVELIREKRGGKALSIADGEGRNGVFIAEQGLDVLSIDISPLGQEKARKLANERGVKLRFELADLATWRWPTAEFDLIAGIFFQFCPPDVRTRVFAGITKALKPGGLLLIQGYRPKQLEYKTGGPSEAERLYTRELLREAFWDFSSLDIEEHDSQIAEGTAHVGMSALIDLVGRK